MKYAKTHYRLAWANLAATLLGVCMDPMPGLWKLPAALWILVLAHGNLGWSEK